MNTKRILLYYKYITIPDPQAIMAWQKELCQNLGLTGRIIIATEGINGTVCGSQEQTAAYIEAMSAHELFGRIDWKDSIVNGVHEYFPKLQIKVKNEITNLGLDTEVYTAEKGAEHLTPAQWHEAVAQADPANTIIFDNRNAFEARVGAFEGAVIPDVEFFRDFPAYVDKNIDLFKDKEVLMYCTGGVRCERASAYLIAKGVSKGVKQLDGGIHRYAEQFPDGFFRGKNYVFDGRITVPVTNDVLGTCDVCGAVCDDYTNCLNAKCNKHFIGCPECIDRLQNMCSDTCDQLVREGKVKKRPLRQRVDPTITQ
jgi:predicted sulfurtransferase